LEDIIASVIGNPVKLVCKLTPPTQTDGERVVASKKREGSIDKNVDKALTDEGDKDIIKTAKEIFGS
jgi:hypothetical protein